MNCPRCEQYELVEQVRDGVRIDHCARCRGIWLDRGELERLLLAARDEEQGAAAPRGTVRPPDEHRPYDRDDDDDDRGRGGEPPRKRRRWFDLLDFD